MNRPYIAAVLSLLAVPLAGQTPAASPAPPVATRTAPPAGFTQTIVLWPNGAPLAHGTTEGDIPKLFTYPAAGPGPHSAVVVAPGGGWLAAHGVTAFVLEYRLSPAYTYPAPQLDASRAIRYVRSHAAELGVKPDAIGIWGFSAGGHLSGYMATIHKPGDPAAADPIDRVSDRPDFAILSYAPLSMDFYVRNNKAPLTTLIGEHATQAQIDAVDPLKHVSADTSPCFIYSTTGDKTVDSHNAAEFYAALRTAGIPAEMHVFELGAHGTHMGENLPPAMHELTVTPVLIANWMQLHGWMTPEAAAQAAQ
jgi:acetyl esterase/lipase